MPAKLPFRIDPTIEEYIRSRSTDLRIATTCEGPLIFPIKISPPKPTDIVIEVGTQRLYISAVQAPRIKVIDTRMLPRCVLQKKK